VLCFQAAPDLRLTAAGTGVGGVGRGGRDGDEKSVSEAIDRPTEKKSGGWLWKLVLAILIIALAGGGGAGIGLWYSSAGDSWQEDLAPVAAVGEELVFTVEKGWTLTKVGEALAEQGLVRSGESFIRLGKTEGKAEQLKAGRYILSPAMSSGEILEELVKGQIFSLRFTIPEGYTLRQVAGVFAEKGIAEPEDFWREVREGQFDYPFLEGLPADEYRLEGYLFPDTYIIEVDEPIHSVCERMLKRFVEVWDSLPASDRGVSQRDTVIMASIVQNEVKLDEERPIAAGIFFRRLDIGMLLQSCATVQYYFERPKFPLLNADLEIDFPYNTYLYAGLPPAPVGCPGKASLAAALTPQDTDYLYFVAREDGSGGHYFSRTLAEHNRNNALAKENRARGGQ
jgi:UPF0755 protein